MTTPAFHALLAEARSTHEKYPDLASFCSFPGDLSPIDLRPYHVPSADLMAGETNWSEDDLTDFRDAFIAAGPDAQWRETYKDTTIGDDFMERFACYCLIGDGGGWKSEKVSAYVVYMPAGLHYTWHQHPAEELYFMIAGEAEFLREGKPSQTLRAGQSSFHASNQPHATTTHGHPMMAYVLWRNNLNTPPVLTDREVAQ